MTLTTLTPTSKTAILAASLMLAVAGTAQADNGVETIESKPLSEGWINAGFYSAHFQRDKGLNNSNPGLGIEYRSSTVTTWTAGRFYNSDRAYSNYAGAYYQPWSVGLFRLGAVVGGFSGYPKMRNGGWFLAAIPMASVEFERVGLNIGVVPTYKDRLYGAVTFSLRLKVFD
jgi:hypothetical protein